MSLPSVVHVVRISRRSSHDSKLNTAKKKTPTDWGRRFPEGRKIRIDARWAQRLTMQKHNRTPGKGNAISSLFFPSCLINTAAGCKSLSGLNLSELSSVPFPDVVLARCIGRDPCPPVSCPAFHLPSV